MHPTDWVVYPEEHEVGNFLFIGTREWREKILGNLSGYILKMAFPNSADNDEKKAIFKKAEMITRAVNNHDALITSLQSLLNSLEGLTVEGKSGSFLHFDLARKEAILALKKAKGE